MQKMKVTIGVLALALPLLALLTFRQMSANTLEPMVEYSLGVKQTVFDAERVELNFLVSNLSKKDVSILKWYTPFEGVRGKIFLVACNSIDLQYEGPMVKRGLPTESDYLLLRASETKEVNVNLSQVYSFPRNATCTAEFRQDRLKVFDRDRNPAPHIITRKFEEEKVEFQTR